MDIILTIGIPVFNGQNCIKKTLKSIADNLYDAKSLLSVEVLISDNCSTDDTQTKIKEFSDLSIKYYKNSINYGYDFNVDKVIDLAGGEYVWFLGCGEVIKKGSIELLLKKIKLYRASLFILNYDIYEEDIDRIVNEKVYQYELDIASIDTKINLPRYSVSLSANVVDRRKWIENKKDLIEKDWIHVERMLSMQSREDFFLVVLNDLYFTLNRECDGWWTKKNSYNLILQHINILQNSEILGLEKSESRALSGNISYLPLLHSVLIARRRGVDCSKELIMKYLKVQRPIFVLFVIIPTLCIHKGLLFIPEILMHLSLKIRRIIKYIIVRFLVFKK